MSEHVIPSAVAQHLILKFLTKENVKSADIVKMLRVQFGDETLSETQMY
jgi:hypothetical protein